MDPFKRLQSTLGGAREALEDVVLGYQIAPSSERAALVALLSVGFVSQSPVSGARVSSSQLRLGLAASAMAATGIAAALNRDDGREARYAVPFGVGAGLAVDEAPRWVTLAANTTAILGVGGLVQDLHRRGAVHRAIRQLAGPSESG